MAHPYHHAVSTSKKWGGKPEDYQAIHDWFDETKAHFADFRHRALRHHSEGIFLCEFIFGVTVTNSDGRQVPVRSIGEQHVKEDLGRIPTVKDWLERIQPAEWMMRKPPPKNVYVKQEGGRRQLHGEKDHAEELPAKLLRHYERTVDQRSHLGDYGGIKFAGEHALDDFTAWAKDWA